MNTLKTAATAAFALALAGCATPQAPQHSTQDVKAYCAQRMADDRIDPLRDKILLPLTIGEPQPIEMLANRSFATTDAERKAILALAEAHTVCNKFASERLGAPPGYRASSHDRITAALSELYAGDITYGEFAKQMLFIGARDQAAREDIEQAIKARERWAEIDAAN